MRANPTFSLGVVTRTDFQAAIAALPTADAAVDAQNTELTRLQDDRDDQIKTVIDLTARTRAGVKSAFGPGLGAVRSGRRLAGHHLPVASGPGLGTRKSERKPRSNKKKSG